MRKKLWIYESSITDTVLRMFDVNLKYTLGLSILYSGSSSYRGTRASQEPPQNIKIYTINQFKIENNTFEFTISILSIQRCSV